MADFSAKYFNKILDIGVAESFGKLAYAETAYAVFAVGLARYNKVFLAVVDSDSARGANQLSATSPRDITVVIGAVVAAKLQQTFFAHKNPFF